MAATLDLAPPRLLRDIVERTASGLTVLAPAARPVRRRVLYVNSYGGHAYWERMKQGRVAPHHLWGCLELVRMGYEVALAEPLPDFYLHRNPLPHDLRLLRFVRSWLGTDGLIYCGHNVLYWLPLLRALHAHRGRIVSLLFAREPLDHARAHDGIIALTGAAADHARRIAPHARVAQLGWGADLELFPTLPYRPEFFLSCGRTRRDHRTLCSAATLSRRLFKVVSPGSGELVWPANVRVVGAGAEEALDYQQLLHEEYAACAASLVVLQSDPAEHTAVGMTNVIEAMAMGRPVVVTRTGALPSEIDVEASGCGLFVPPDRPDALTAAIESIATHPHDAERMGERGRALCASRYNLNRYAADLHAFFENL